MDEAVIYVLHYRKADSDIKPSKQGLVRIYSCPSDTHDEIRESAPLVFNFENSVNLVVQATRKKPLEDIAESVEELILAPMGFTALHGVKSNQPRDSYKRIIKNTYAFNVGQ